MKNRPTNRIQSTGGSNNFVTKDDLEANFSRFRKAKEALSTAKKLLDRTEQLSASAAQAVYERYPSIVDVKSETALTEEQRKNFVQGISELLQIVQYCLVVGGTGPLDEFLPGRLESYRASGQSVNWYLAALEHLKKHSLLERDEALEANFYFDYLIRNMT